MNQGIYLSLDTRPESWSVICKFLIERREISACLSADLIHWLWLKLKALVTLKVLKVGIPRVLEVNWVHLLETYLRFFQGWQMMALRKMECRLTETLFALRRWIESGLRECLFLIQTYFNFNFNKTFFFFYFCQPWNSINFLTYF